MLTREIASIIVKETSIRLNRNINIMDDKGVIIASGNSARIGDIHEGALAVLRTGETISITKEDVENWKGAMPGINLPIQFQDRVVGVIGITGNPKELQEFAGLVKMTTEVLIKQEYISSQMEWKQRTKERIIEDLLKTPPSLAHVERGLALLGIHFIPPFTACVIQIEERDISNTVLLRRVEQLIGEREGIISLININRIFIAFQKMSSVDIEKKVMKVVAGLENMGVVCRLSYSSPFHNMAEFNTSYLDCDLALDISGKDEKIIPFSKVESKALIFKIELAEANKFSKRLMNKPLEKYADTLQVFFDNNLNIHATAAAMFLHRNTLVYRLSKIQEETGFDPKVFYDALTLQLALWTTEKTRKTIPPAETEGKDG
ncbi:CdaR family transcriptional regulator [Bacillus sp. B-jedd]|uniref:CdaR family transcriptional regulator n=1 Tax=Bacillus sp. B-jedd TaxID=1476857 RepID=UPI0005157052|nr:sugar diacid recognition domain-containing protein [Bacillus sp. B-jedd]CEG28673.1 sugar diacid utilization regulator [Bacillus sp. B-jedd]